jgi:ABC-type branched-subunit amino acid transport system substrate-binding protein
MRRRTTNGRRATRIGLSLLAVGAVLAGCSGSGTTTTSATRPTQGGGQSTAPGVTPTQIDMGAIATRTGVGAGDFNAFIPGVQAYFDMVNKEGGVNGRKLVLADNLDDGGSPTTFTQLTHTLLDQDKVFAAFISTFWFSPNLFAEAGTPTYGYNVSGNWAGPGNLFAAGGSIQDYHALAAPIAYLVKRTHATSVALVSYGPGIPGSYPACSTAASDLQKAGITVSYSDFDSSLGGNFTTAVQEMRQHGSNFVVSCMEGSDDISMSRAIQQYGLKVHQLWLTGYQQSMLDEYSSLMQGVYVDANGFVPYAAATSFPGEYPGMENYLSTMEKYEPAYATNQLATQGWMSAALLAAGVKAAGSDLTQQNVIDQTNRITDFTAGGLSALVDWTDAHTTQTFPVCPSFVVVQGEHFVPVVDRGHQVFICFAHSTDLKNPVPVSPPPGTPGS